MPSVTYDQNTNSISGSFEKIGREEIGKQLQASKSLFDKAKTPSCKKALEQLIPLLKGKDITHSDLFHLNEIYKDLIQSLDKEPDLDHSLVYKALGLDKEQAELNDASNLDDLKNKIAGFNQKKLLEMCNLSKITYGDVDRKLDKGGYKTKKQFEEEGYQIIKFYDNELIQDKYCSDNGYKLEQHNVGYALTGNNSYTRDAGYVFIKDKIEVTIAYHGTRDLNDVKEDLRASLAKLSFLPEDNHVHSGFYSLFKRSWPNVHKILQGHANDKGLAIKDLEINVTGHSMGGALASIAALCLNKTEGAKDVHVATFGSPRVLYQDAAEVYSKYLGEKTIRVACQSDPVPCLPFGSGGTAYKHVGKPLRPGTDKYVDYPEGFYHKLDTYYNLIQEIKQKGFTSEDSTSKYLILTYALRLFPSFLQMVSSNGELNNKEFFEKVKEENKDIKLSEIPIEYAPKLEEKLKQGEQEVAKLTEENSQLEEKSNSEITKLRDESNRIKTQLKEKTEEISKLNNQVDLLTEKNSQLEGQLNSVKQNLTNTAGEVTQLTEKRSQLEGQLNSVKQELEKAESKNKELDDANQALNAKTIEVTRLTENLERIKTQLAEREKELNSINQDLVNKTSEVTQLQEKFEKTETKFAKKKEEFTEKEKKLQQGLADKTSEVTRLTEEFENKSKELDVAKKNVSQLEKDLKQDASTLNNQETQLTRPLSKLG